MTVSVSRTQLRGVSEAVVLALRGSVSLIPYVYVHVYVYLYCVTRNPLVLSFKLTPKGGGSVLSVARCVAATCIQNVRRCQLATNERGEGFR